MPSTPLLLMSVGSLALGAAFFLYPKAVLKFSQALNRSLVMLDDILIRYRHLSGLLAFAASYAFFRLAFLLPRLGQ